MREQPADAVHDVKHVTFQTTVAINGNNTGVVVAPELIEALGAGGQPPVLVNLNGYKYRTTVGVMRGKHMVGISAATRSETGLQGGDPITVTLTDADAPREVTLPADFAAALVHHPDAQAFFRTLANSVQRYHIDNVNGAKAQETRQRRIDKAIGLFLDGKAR